MLGRVALVRTDVSEETSASFIRVTRIGELGTTLTATSNRRALRRNTRRFLQEPHGVTSQKTPFFGSRTSSSDTSTQLTYWHIPHLKLYTPYYFNFWSTPPPLHKRGSHQNPSVLHIHSFPSPHLSYMCSPCQLHCFNYHTIRRNSFHEICSTWRLRNIFQFRVCSWNIRSHADVCIVPS
jgi:hypothetical protein